MYKPLAALAACILLAACGGSTPTDPTKIPALSKVRFLAFGDSMTAGEVTVPVGIIADGPTTGILNPPNTRQVLVPAASYPTQLLSMLQSRYVIQAPTISVTSAGKAGEYSFQALTRLADTLAEVKPEVLLLLHGVNDLPFQNTDLPTGALIEMTRQGKNAGARVFLSTLMPFKPGGRNSPNAALVAELNVRIKTIALTEGVVLVDLFDTLAPEANTLIGVDGLHPTEAGYKRIADVFFTSIQANLEVK